MNRVFRKLAPDPEYLEKTRTYIRRLGPRTPPLGYPATPQVTLQWEKDARILYHAALMYRICTEMGLGHPDLDRFAARTLSTLADLQDWRPQGPGGFDRNNWANGYLPGSWGLLGGTPEMFHARGTSYIQQLPGANHWVKRSTNHGIVIFASYLTGAQALGQPLAGREVLREIVERSLKDGCYLEGINYLSFILSELLPWLVATWDPTTPWQGHVAHELPGLSGAKTMLRWMTGARGDIRATFGDVRDLKIYQNGVRFADSLAPDGNLSHEIAPHQLRQDDRLEPLTRALPHGNPDSPFPKGTHIFPSHMVCARSHNWSLWILGSRVHLTHNGDHDCGSFFFERGDMFVGEEHGRAAFRHNVPLMRDAPNFPEAEGCVPFRKRHRHGSITQIGSTAWKVDAPRTFDGCPTQILNHIRHLHVIDDCLVVLDRVITQGSGEPVVQFHTHDLTSLWGKERFRSRSLCHMRKGPKGWRSASVVGARDRLRVEHGHLLFRGHRIAFP